MYFKKTSDRAITPKRGNPYDAGLDLFALDDVSIDPGQIVKIHTGIHIALKQHEAGLYWEKSGRSWDVKLDRPIGLQILGGCIDGPYRGELIIIATNANIYPQLELLNWLANVNQRLLDLDIKEKNRLTANYRNSCIRIPYGKAITQLLVTDGLKFKQPEELTEKEWEKLATTDRGEKGFGSTD